MFYDFNIPYPNQPEHADLARIERILARIHSLQRSTIALNHTVVDTIRNVKPLAPITPQRFPGLQQLSRVTLVVENAKTNYLLTGNNPAGNHIDILAVQPTNVDVCKHACQTYEVDLITMDMSKIRCSPGYAAAKVAIERGIFFEICYTQCLRDPQRRSMFFSNVKKLVEVTRGDNLILSSEALCALEIRRTSDLRMLGLLFGMTPAQAEAACGGNYARLLRKSETRRLTITAAISVYDPSQKRKAIEEHTEDTRAKKGKKKT